MMPFDFSCKDVLLVLYRQEHSLSSAQRLQASALTYAKLIGKKAANISKIERLRGKPCFPLAPDICFSISHSGEFWACAFYGSPIGLDLESHRSCDKNAIANRFFHPTEAEYLARREYQPFFDVWTAKESYVKYLGTGIDGAFADFSTVQNGQLASQIGKASVLHIPFLPAYSLCLCAEGFENVHLMPHESFADFQGFLSMCNGFQSGIHRVFMA